MNHSSRRRSNPTQVSGPRCTAKQIAYINFLLDRHEAVGTEEDMVHEINPDLGEDEDFSQWLLRQDIRRASEVIDILKENLPT